MKAWSAWVTWEAREQRWLASALFVVMCCGLAYFHAADITWSPLACTLYELGPLPIGVLVCMGLLITESFTRESENERGERLDTLPIGRGSMTVAKLLWLLAAGTLLVSALGLFETLWTLSRGSVWEGQQYEHALQLKDLPLEVYGPIWIAWAIALGACLRRWLFAAFALAASVVGSVLIWPWPLHQPAVVPGWLMLFAVCAIPAALALPHVRLGWLLPRESLRHTVRILGIGCFAFGAIGVVQVAGRDGLTRPEPGETRVWSVGLSPDGNLLSMTTSSSPFATLSGREDTRISSWLVDANSGEVLQDGWQRGFYSVFGFVYESAATPASQAILMDGYSNSGLWMIHAKTGAKQHLSPSLTAWFQEHWWQVSPKESNLYVDPPGTRGSYQTPWDADITAHNRDGVVLALWGDELKRHDLKTNTTRVLAKLPRAGDKQGWRLELSHFRGEVLRASHPEQETHFFDTDTGSLLATVAGGMEIQWTGGMRPFAVARPTKLDEDGNLRFLGLDSLWIGDDGVREVTLPHGGEVASSASGRIFLGGKKLLELDRNGQVLRELVLTPRK